MKIVNISNHSRRPIIVKETNCVASASYSANKAFKVVFPNTQS